MKALNPHEYEYLWTDYEIDFIFTSCYLSEEFRKADIVLIYGHMKKGLKFFLAKKDMKKFAEYGVELYEKRFSSWKQKIKRDIAAGKNLIEETKNDIDRASSMTDEELKQRILERARLFQSLGGDYFYTEFFFLDKAEKLLKNEPQKHRQLKKNLEEMGRLKFDARKVLTQFYDYSKIFRPYAEEAAKRTKRKDLRWLGFQEIIGLLDGKDIEISDRERMNWVLAKRNKWDMIRGKEADRIMEGFDEHFFNKKADMVKGTIANKGVYTGTVRIVRTIFSGNMVDEIKKVKKGNVLVAETTGPDVMEACEKAGAIVTEEGGMTSHAAIVSRELGIPCIVGTKTATKVFKDGDYVEVDANKGIVRKIINNKLKKPKK